MYYFFTDMYCVLFFFIDTVSELYGQGLYMRNIFVSNYLENCMIFERSALGTKYILYFLHSSAGKCFPFR
jgi:hypothetical protein